MAWHHRVAYRRRGARNGAQNGGGQWQKLNSGGALENMAS